MSNSQAREWLWIDSWTTTLKRDDLYYRYLVYWFIWTLSRSCSKVKVIGQSSRSLEENNSCGYTRPWRKIVSESETVSKQSNSRSAKMLLKWSLRPRVRCCLRVVSRFGYTRKERWRTLALATALRSSESRSARTSVTWSASVLTAPFCAGRFHIVPTWSSCHSLLCQHSHCRPRNRPTRRCVAWWRCGRALHLRLTGRSFNSQPVRFHVT